MTGSEVIDRVEALLLEAEGLDDPREKVEEALAVLGPAFEEIEVDVLKLEQLGVRFASHVRREGDERGREAGHALLEAVQGFKDHHYIPRVRRRV